ncbi:hypothetical protein M8A51_23540 [Schlegelella sp. S2-27]|uniref:Uncharacterized protein n=1 Tax=Caldimonas mangrovi TaxID=2944811 RepID=A0ABT0YVT2_9BURK|nr:hypothetical protein [Caldimonas mangrovi]MCM5682514.1 hypothetical protein [Caldimonas mangrovi]
MAGIDYDHGMQVTDHVDIEGRAAATLAVSAAAAQTSTLDEGVYDIWCDVDVYVKVGATANDVTTATGYLIRADSTVAVLVRRGSRIGAIAGGAGTLSYHVVR